MAQYEPRTDRRRRVWNNAATSAKRTDLANGCTNGLHASTQQCHFGEVSSDEKFSQLWQEGRSKRVDRVGGCQSFEILQLNPYLSSAGRLGASNNNNALSFVPLEILHHNRRLEKRSVERSFEVCADKAARRDKYKFE